MTDPRIGFIGLGQMGGGVALNLRRAGYEVCVYDQRTAATDEQVSAGCVLGADVSDVGTRSDVVFTSLPDPRAARPWPRGTADCSAACALAARGSTCPPTRPR
jgi:3-hydroxyisobutyrate dehydrogenase